MSRTQTDAAPPYDQRGSTTIPAAVVARIAEQVASEYPHVGGPAGGVLGLGARRQFDTRPSVECDLYGSVAVLRMDLGVSFPVSLTQTCHGVREHVRTQVQELTGLEVGRMDVEISWLHPGRVRGALR